MSDPVAVGWVVLERATARVRAAADLFLVEVDSRDHVLERVRLQEREEGLCTR